MLSNTQHLNRAIDAVLDLRAERIDVIGLEFKENTDDLRESPVVALLEQLIGKGRDAASSIPRSSSTASTDLIATSSSNPSPTSAGSVPSRPHPRLG